MNFLLKNWGWKLDILTHSLTVFVSTGSNYYVRILSTIDRELLKPSASVALHKHSNALVDVLPPEADSSIAMLSADEKPNVAYSDIGGMDVQKQEIREAVELPLTHFELYKQIGIDPPRGVLMFGPPWMRENYACQGCSTPHNSCFYPGCWVRICTKISWWRSKNGTWCVQVG